MKQTPPMGLTSLKINSHNWENIGKLAIEKLKNWHEIGGKNNWARVPIPFRLFVGDFQNKLLDPNTRKTRKFHFQYSVHLLLRRNSKQVMGRTKFVLISIWNLFGSQNKRACWCFWANCLVLAQNKGPERKPGLGKIENFGKGSISEAGKRPQEVKVSGSGDFSIYLLLPLSHYYLSLLLLQRKRG